MCNFDLLIDRRSYWKQIASGRIPRGSTPAMILLDSIDIGLESSHLNGFHDYQSIEVSLKHLIYFDTFDFTSFSCMNVKFFGWLQPIRQIMLDQHNSDMIITLTSFIAANEYAQRKIPLYLGN